MSAVVHVLKTARATFWTGPQVFQTVHYMACREKIRRIYRTVQNSAVQYSTVQYSTDLEHGVQGEDQEDVPPPPVHRHLQLTAHPCNLQ